jgi:hypothetical protein
VTKNASAKEWLLDAYSGRRYSTNVDPNPSPPGVILFDMDLSNPGGNYGMTRYALVDPTGMQSAVDGLPNGDITHMATGGPGGTPCVRYTQFAGRYQYQLGHHAFIDSYEFDQNTPGSDTLWIRWKVRIANGMTWDAATCGGKFIDIGGATADRIIVWLSSPSTGGTSIGADNDSADIYGRPTFQTAAQGLPPHFGLTGGASAWGSTYANKIGSQSVTRGVSANGTWPGLITVPDYGTQPNCGPNSDPTLDGWVYGQCGIKLGNSPYQDDPATPPPTNAAPHRSMKLWMNNSDQNNPTAEQGNYYLGIEDENMGGSDWDGTEVKIGTYCGGGSGSFSSEDFIFDVAGLQIGTAFDPDWYPG